MSADVMAWESDDHDEREVAWLLERELWAVESVLEFVVEGDPASKARARFDNRYSKTRTYTPAKTVEAERLCAEAAKLAGAGLTEPDAQSCFGLMAVFFTASWQRRDVDNMLKLVSDALTGLIWKDDSQVTEMSARVVRATDDPRSHVQVYRTIPQRPDTQPCPVCGQPVRSYKSVKYRTCSKECSVAFQRSVDWSCVGCGKKERRTPYQAKAVYCSQACTSNRIVFACLQCGTSVDKPASYRQAGRKFCSSACWNTYRVGRPRSKPQEPQ